MSLTQQSPTETTLPTRLKSPRAKLVYLYLRTNGTASISDMQTGLDMKKIALYSILKTLRKRDLVERDGEEFTALQ